MDAEQAAVAWYSQRERDLRDEMLVLNELGDKDEAEKRQTAAGRVHAAAIAEVIDRPPVFLGGGEEHKQYP